MALFRVRVIEVAPEVLESTTIGQPTQAKSRNVKTQQYTSCLHTPIIITNIDIVCKKFGEKKFEHFSHIFSSSGLTALLMYRTKQRPPF